MPQNESNIDNIKSFAESSIERDLDGLLLTLWDDDSPHFELYGRGIAAFAEYAWAGAKTSKSEVKEKYRERSFGNILADSSYAFIDLLEGPVAFWKNALLEEGEQRNNLRKYDNPIGEAVIEMPDRNVIGQWSERYEQRLEQARQHLQTTKDVELKIAKAIENSSRNQYTLEVYEQVNQLIKFSLESLLTLESYDRASAENVENALRDVKALSGQFKELRDELELVYGRSRILEKPLNYKLDQDHHTHNANQSLNFDWQFYPEMLMLKKIDTKLL